MLWLMKEVRRRRDALGAGEATHGALCVPRPPVPLMMGQPFEMALPQSLEGIA